MIHIGKRQQQKVKTPWQVTNLRLWEGQRRAVRFFNIENWTSPAPPALNTLVWRWHDVLEQNLLGTEWIDRAQVLALPFTDLDKTPPFRTSIPLSIKFRNNPCSACFTRIWYGSKEINVSDNFQSCEVCRNSSSGRRMEVTCGCHPYSVTSEGHMLQMVLHRGWNSCYLSLLWIKSFMTPLSIYKGCI